MNTKIDIMSSGNIASPKGFYAGATYAGIKKKGEKVLDLAILFSDTPCTAVGLFTRNVIKAAPVVLSEKNLKSGKASAVVINSGCANACTGEQGLKDARMMTELAAKKLGVAPADVLVASTGVIGVPLPMKNVESGIKRITVSRDGGHDLTRAIMTTDTRPKEIAVKVRDGESEYFIAGTAKGSGMLHPDMATMLCFLTTDAAVDAGLLLSSLKDAAAISLNMVSVDGDTSTNDTVFLLANGQAKNKTILPGTRQAETFRQALEQVCVYLAKCLARDGEGATRLIEVTVSGASNQQDAVKAAKTIISSPLVKTAVHGCDPNWGRIVAAAGRSGASMIEAVTDVYIGDICLFKSGVPQPFTRKTVADILSREEVLLRVELNQGKASATAWGCDLSREYVTINAEYTT
jgi:glutamate N-acetyltransferase / amino-acid N-acetyltransferase